MFRPAKLICLLLLSLIVMPSMADDYQRINWVDLLPKSDLDALTQPPEYLNEIEDGSADDQISSQLTQALTAASDDTYQQALISTNVVAEMNNKPITLPGFVVPISFNEEQDITEFFLVPYFGACIHVPPPPPNQIIYIQHPKGLALNDIYQAYWLSGVLSTELTENGLATSAYSLTLKKIERYEEEYD